MNFRDFETTFSLLPVFNLNDVRKLDPGFFRQQLAGWVKQGRLRAVAGGYYTWADQVIDEPFLLMAANRIYAPSYVSLESALAYYGVIPETVFGVTSLSSRKTMLFESSWGSFTYRSIKPLYMLGYRLVADVPKRTFQIASPEKAVLDYLYLHHEISSGADFEALRWNRARLTSLLDEAIFANYLRVFGKQALEHRAKLFREYLHA